MASTLLIHDNPSFIDLLKLNLSVYVGTEVIVKRNFKESKALMEHHKGIDLIICAASVEGEQTAELTYRFHKDKNPSRPIIITGDGSSLPSSERVRILPERSELQLLLQTAAQFLNVTSRSMVEKAVPDFYPLSVYYCLNLRSFPCDVFLEESPGSYTLRYPCGSAFTEEEFHRLAASGVGKIFVRASDRLKFVNAITEVLIAVLQDEKTDPRRKINFADKSLQVLQDEAMKGESHVEMSVKVLAISAVKTCMEIARQNPRIASLLKDLMSNRTSLRFKHIQLTIYICNHIVSHLEWGSNEVKEKLAFVAFFHDLFLMDDRLVKVNGHNFEELEGSLSREERELVLRHARQAAEVVQKFPVAPLGSDVIIQQHHGVLGGKGFTKEFSNDLSPLTIIFIVAEEFAQMILDREDAADMGALKDDMISKLYGKFPRSKYVKLIDNLKSIQF